LILRDPVHGLVSFEADEEAIVPRLLEAAEVQRMRRIKQLGLTSFSFPGADHTRFSHAVGAAHVMSRLLARLRRIHDALPYWQRVTTERARDALAAALLHDVGHGPFSHLFEEALPDGPSHEDWSERILKDPSTDVHRILQDHDSTMVDRVVDLIRGKHPLTYLARAVSGTFDVDRCDYLLRDAYFTGVGYGSFDLDWLLRSFRFGIEPDPSRAPPLAIDGAKGIPAIESFILARLFMFQQIYFHKASRASEWMLTRAVARLRDLLSEGVPVAPVPQALADLATRGDANISDYLATDDHVMWTSLAAWQKTSDPILSDLSRRIYQRRLFKTYELYGEQAEPQQRSEAHLTARAIAEEHGLDPDMYVGLDLAADRPYDDTHEALTVVFPDGSQQRPADVSFLLGRLRGQDLMRARLIFAAELRDPIVEAIGK
jgi:HD superfamily phosphohydrolase